MNTHTTPSTALKIQARMDSVAWLRIELDWAESNGRTEAAAIYRRQIRTHILDANEMMKGAA